MRKAMVNRLKVYIEKSKHNSKAFDFFNFETLDAFHNQNILSVIHGKEWCSVLITDEEKAFLHTFCKQQIGDTGWYDIEPFLGYGGAVTNTNDKSFICRALEMYTSICREEKIIGEIIRFNCILDNHFHFESNLMVEIYPAKQIVVVECFKEDEQQLKMFSKPCRRRVKRGLKDCNFEVIDKTKDWEKFLEFYFSSLNRAGAHKKWYFSPGLFERARKSDNFNVYMVRSEEVFASASLVIEYPLAAYYFLAVNSDEYVPGAGELLIFKIAQTITDKNIRFLFLGGGNSAAPDDPLLRFKKKFDKTTKTFFMGKIVHNTKVFKKLCYDAAQINPAIENSKIFLKYRLLNNNKF